MAKLYGYLYSFPFHTFNHGSSSLLGLSLTRCYLSEQLGCVFLLPAGVGGIEAEAVMLGQPISMVLPEVVGYKLLGNPEPLVTSTDIVLTITKVICLLFCYYCWKLCMFCRTGLVFACLGALSVLPCSHFGAMLLCWNNLPKDNCKFPRKICFPEARQNSTADISWPVQILIWMNRPCKRILFLCFLKRSTMAVFL